MYLRFHDCTDKNNEKHIVNAGEAISFRPNEGRSLLNETNLLARILVISNTPKIGSVFTLCNLLGMN